MGLLSAPPDAGEDVDTGAVYIWPENVAAWQAFQSVQSQWRVGMSGATGLDYAGVRTCLELLGTSPRQLRAIWPGLQACEQAVLRVWGEERERQRKKAEDARRD